MNEANPELWQEGAENSSWPERPWLTIMIHPRSTIRSIVDTDPRRYVILLVMVTGIISAFSNASKNNYGDEILQPIVLVVLIIILGTIGGLMGWVVGGVILHWTGSLFGGEATPGQVRAAMAWSSVPFIICLLFWLAMLLLYGYDLFTSKALRVESNPYPLLLLNALIMIMSIWWYFLFWKCYAEVQRLSLLKAFIAIFVPMLLIIACTGVSPLLVI